MKAAEAKRSEQLSEILDWPSVLDMCRQLGCSVTYGYGLIWRGKIAAQKIGNVWRVSPQGIREYSLKRKSRVQQ
jgi:hypothetical protein